MKLVLRAIPNVVYKVPSRLVRHTGGQEEYSFWLQIHALGKARVRRVRGVLRFYSGRKLIESLSAPPGFWRSRIVSSQTAGRPGVYYLRLRTPDAAGLDKVTFALDILCGRETARRHLSLPVMRYRSPVLLSIPVRGGALVFTDHTVRHGAEAGWFALDLLGLGPGNGLTRKYPPARPEDYFGPGTRITAPGPGIIVRTTDGVPDNKELGHALSRKERLNCWRLRDWLLFGNHVVIRHARRCYSLLAHLKRGSVTVMPGEVIERAQTVGRLGNSGLSRLPHLHFQMMNSPDAFKAAGLPAYFKDIQIREYGRFRNALLRAGMYVQDCGQSISV